MTITWKQNTNPNLITDQLENAKIITKDGNLSFKAFDYDIYSTLLFNILEFPIHISEADAREMISNSIRNHNPTVRITPQSVKDRLNNQEGKFSSLPYKRYVLASKISINPIIKLERIYLGNKQIFVEQNLPSQFNQKPREELLKNASAYVYGEFPKNYSQIRIYVSSQSIYDAADRALESCDFLRGIWNWVINRTFTFRKTLGGNLKPINKIILGPIHTLHYTDGNLIKENIWWYEPGYQGAITPYNPDQENLNVLMKSQVNIRKSINKLHYSNDLTSAFIRYARALDSKDYLSSFLKLWGILEFLTNTHNEPGRDVTVRRVASLYEEREFHVQILKILKEFRNSYVHSGKESNELEFYLVRLKNYVDTMLHFHVTNKFHFASIEKASEFLDITTNKDVFSYQLKLYNYAKKFRHF
jgi:hypothetical protein